MPPTRGGKANTENLVCKGAGPQCPSKPALVPSTLTDSQTASRGRCGMGGLSWHCCCPPAFHPRLVPWPLRQEPSPLSVTDTWPTEVTTATTTDDFQGLWRGQPGTDTSSGKIPRLARDDLARKPPGRGLAIGLTASGQFCNLVQFHCLLQKPGSLSKPGTKLTVPSEQASPHLHNGTNRGMGEPSPPRSRMDRVLPTTRTKGSPPKGYEPHGHASAGN